MFQPILERLHPVHNGVQKLYRFSNNFGASVVRFRLPATPYSELGGSYGSYTDNENEWEVGIIKFDGAKDDDYDLEYGTPISDDVIGHVSDDKLEMLLYHISLLNKDGDYRGIDTPDNLGEYSG